MALLLGSCKRQFSNLNGGVSGASQQDEIILDDVACDLERELSIRPSRPVIRVISDIRGVDQQGTLPRNTRDLLSSPDTDDSAGTGQINIRSPSHVTPTA